MRGRELQWRPTRLPVSETNIDELLPDWRVPDDWYLVIHQSEVRRTFRSTLATRKEKAGARPASLTSVRSYRQQSNCWRQQAMSPQQACAATAAAEPVNSTTAAEILRSLDFMVVLQRLVIVHVNQHQPSQAASTAQIPVRAKTLWTSTARYAPVRFATQLGRQRAPAGARRNSGTWRWRSAPCPCNPAGSNRCKRPTSWPSPDRLKSGNRKAREGWPAAYAWPNDMGSSIPRARATPAVSQAAV